jgi:hypothetical protein
MKLGALVLAAATSLFCVTTLEAAEITCVSVWGRDAEPAKILAYRPPWKERFPSGRRPTPATCGAVLIKGVIELGDSAKFAALLHANHPFLSYVHLWSPGGSVEEALKIGRLIRKAMLITEAPWSVLLPPDRRTEGSGRLDLLPGTTICEGADCHCASACFIVWAAGIMRYGDVLGLHRPSLRSTSFADLPPAQASELYRMLLGRAEAYLSEMEVSRQFIEIMNGTPPDQMHWIGALSEPSINDDVPSIAEWLAAACGTNDELRSAIVALRTKKGLSQREKLELEQLKIKSQARYNEVSDCKLMKIDRSRDAITEFGLPPGYVSPRGSR